MILIFRLGGKPLENYINNRKLKREEMIFDETERQRLRCKKNINLTY